MRKIQRLDSGGCRAWLVLPLAALLLSAGCSGLRPAPGDRAATSAAAAGKAAGYLKPGERPDGIALLRAGTATKVVITP